VTGSGGRTRAKRQSMAVVQQRRIKEYSYWNAIMGPHSSKRELQETAVLPRKSSARTLNNAIGRSLTFHQARRTKPRPPKRQGRKWHTAGRQQFATRLARRYHLLHPPGRNETALHDHKPCEIAIGRAEIPGPDFPLQIARRRRPEQIYVITETASSKGNKKTKKSRSCKSGRRSLIRAIAGEHGARARPRTHQRRKHNAKSTMGTATQFSDSIPRKAQNRMARSGPASCPLIQRLLTDSPSGSAAYKGHHCAVGAIPSLATQDLIGRFIQFIEHL